MSNFGSSFYDLGLTDEISDRVRGLGYDTPTPVQRKVIPSVLMQRDVIACAETGTGKSAAFLLPMIDILICSGSSRTRLPRALAIVNTRELALQLKENFDAYTNGQDLSSVLLIGGVGTSKQEKEISKGVDVIIATPGCLLDHLENGRIILNDIVLFVLDEADRMLDMGFIPDVRKICSYLPESRQNLMFSATMPADIENLANSFMNNPKKIYVSPQSTVAANIEQNLVQLENFQHKLQQIKAMLQHQSVKNALVFCNRKSDVKKIHTYLEQNAIPAAVLHGDMNQHLRLACLKSFRGGEVPYLVCSDVAARGLDIPSVSHIFNFDVPDHAEDYVHRIGRTGRAGKKGYAFTFCLPEDKVAIEQIKALPGAKFQEDTKSMVQPLRNQKKKRNKLPYRIGVEKVQEENHPFGHPDNIPDFLKD